MEHIRGRLERFSPSLIDTDGMRRAAVALILRSGDGSNVEALFIQRAESENDPWSGQLAFPGGGLEPNDDSLADAAVRETREEIGVELRHELQVGRIDDIQGRNRGGAMNLAISCFIYHLDHEPAPKPNYEVADVFWSPLYQLRDESRQLQYLTRYRESPYPGIHLGHARSGADRILWGLTYRFVQRFLEVTA